MKKKIDKNKNFNGKLGIFPFFFIVHMKTIFTKFFSFSLRFIWYLFCSRLARTQNTPIQGNDSNNEIKCTGFVL